METLVAFIRAVDDDSSPLGLATVVMLTVVALGAVYMLGRRMF